MQGLEQEIDLNWLIEFCERQTPFDNFALIGYLVSSNYRLPPTLMKAESVGNETANASAKWLRSNFRNVLYFFCRHQDKKSVVLTGKAVEKSEVIKSLAAALTATFSFPLALGVVLAFAFFASSLGEWCKKYKELSLKGKGKYLGTFPEGQVDAFFDVSYRPAISEIIEDPDANSLSIPKINIVDEAVTRGQVEVTSFGIANSIYRNFSEMGHSYAFRDVLSESEVRGHVEFVRLGDLGKSNVLVFGSQDLQIL